jgi:hypothetical protein
MRRSILAACAVAFALISEWPAAAGPFTDSLASVDSASVEHKANGPTSSSDSVSDKLGSASVTAATIFGESVASVAQTHVAQAGFFGHSGLGQANWFDSITLHGGTGSAHVTLGFRVAGEFVGAKSQLDFSVILGQSSEPIQFSQKGPAPIDAELTTTTTLTYGQALSINAILAVIGGTTGGNDSESLSALAVLNEIILPSGATLTSQSGTEYPIAGSSQNSPLLPGSVGPAGQFVFTNVPTGLWCDPPSASGFDYQMTTPGSLFTEIAGFPTGFASPFIISSGGALLGTGGPGQPLIFPNGGVSEFEITGINPFVDATNSSAFPLELDFNTPTASFTMTPLNGTAAVPEPSSVILFLGGSVFVFGALRRRLIVDR